MMPREKEREGILWEFHVAVFLMVVTITTETICPEWTGHLMICPGTLAWSVQNHCKIDVEYSY